MSGRQTHTYMHEDTGTVAYHSHLQLPSFPPGVVLLLSLGHTFRRQADLRGGHRHAGMKGKQKKKMCVAATIYVEKKKGDVRDQDLAVAVRVRVGATQAAASAENFFSKKQY